MESRPPVTAERLELGAQRDARLHVDLGAQLEGRDRRPRLGHAARDEALRAGELLRRDVALGGAGLGDGGRGRRCGGSCPVLRVRQELRELRALQPGPTARAAATGRRGGGRRGARSARGALDVVLDDPSPGPVPVTPCRSMPCSRARRRASGDAFSRPSGRAAGAAGSGAIGAAGAGVAGASAGGGAAAGAGGAAADAAVGAGGAAGAGVGRRRGRRAVPAGVQRRDDAADGQRLARARDDLQHPGRVGLVRQRRLVGLDLRQRLAARDRIAVGLQPLEDRALLHRVRQPRHDDLGHDYARSRNVASTASTICGSCGKASCSSALE